MQYKGSEEVVAHSILGHDVIISPKSTDENIDDALDNFDKAKESFEFYYKLYIEKMIDTELMIRYIGNNLNIMIAKFKIIEKEPSVTQKKKNDMINTINEKRNIVLKFFPGFDMPNSRK